MASAQQAINYGQVLESGVAESRRNTNPVLPSQEEAEVPALHSNVSISVELIDSDHMPSARPEHLLLGALGDPRLKVLNPIPLCVSVEDSHVVVSWPATEEFGTGATMSAALDDFAASVRELVHRLNETTDLGPDLANVKQHLSEYIAVRR